MSSDDEFDVFLELTDPSNENSVIEDHANEVKGFNSLVLVYT